MDLSKSKSLKERFYSTTQDADLKKAFSEPINMTSEDFNYFAPTKIDDALKILHENPGIRIIGSATDLGVSTNKRKIKLQKLLSLHLIEDFYHSKENGGMITIGARVTLTEFRHFIKNFIPEFANYLDVFASPQIKNIGTIIGNIANASPIGDTPPAFLALKAIVLTVGPKGVSEIPLSDFFLGYRKINLGIDEIITGIKFLIPEKTSTLRFFKNSNRKDLDISAVNFAIKVDWKDDQKKEIKDITIAAGGIAATALRLKKTEQFILANGLSDKNIDAAMNELHSEFQPLSDVRASAAYRRILIENYFRTFVVEEGVLV